jgi:hypothetical protein
VRLTSELLVRPEGVGTTRLPGARHITPLPRHSHPAPRYETPSQTRGWGDIGYNVIVDKFGRIFEGRYGGLSSTVIGAHAGGFNTGTFGVSMLGN